MRPLTTRNIPTPGSAPLTLDRTIGSVVKYLLMSGMHATRLTSRPPKTTPTLRKFPTVRRSASARSRSLLLDSNTAGTKLCATWLSASTIGVRQQKMLNMIWCAAMSCVPSVDDATWLMAM